MSAWRRGGAGGAVLVALLSFLPAGAAGQGEVERLARACGKDSPELTAWCREVALALRGTQGGVALALTGGSPVPGAASTLGRRVGSVPRISVAARGSLGRVRIPSVLDGVVVPAPGDAFVAPAGQLSAAVGLLDGFSLAPTVGGILSVDLLASLSYVSLPESRGYDGGVAAWGVGARVGALRESFTLPGVTLSVVRHGVGSVSMGAMEAADGGRIALDPTVTSIRAVAGKDLMGVGVLAGVGWDRTGGDGRIVARIPGTGPMSSLAGEASTGDFTSSRTVYFGGLSLNFLILQLAAEAGWASGLGAPQGRPGGGFDPDDGSLFGSISARLIY